MTSNPRVSKRPTPEMRSAKILGRKIKSLRTHQSLSQLDLAKKSGQGLYRQLIVKIEAGRYLPTVFQVNAIAKALGQNPIDWLKEILEI